MRNIHFFVIVGRIAVFGAWAAGWAMAEPTNVQTYALNLDLEKDLINDYSKNTELPTCGFTCPKPKIGGEDVVLDYRKKGAMLLRTDATDDATMAFLDTCGIKAIVRLKGQEKRMLEDAERLSKSISAKVIAGFEIEPCGESEAPRVAAKWAQLFPVLAKGFPKAKVILPLDGNKADASVVTAFGPALKSITHVLYRIPKGLRAPSEPVSEFVKQLRSIPELKHTRVMLVMSDKPPRGLDGGKIGATLWRMRAMLTTLAIPGVDAFIFDGMPRPDDFAFAMRNAGALLRNRKELKVRAHGKAPESGDKQDAGDIEWVAFTYHRWGGPYVGLFVVNDSDRPAQLKTEVLNYKHRAPTYWTLGLGPDGKIGSDAWEPDVKPEELFIEVRPATFECVLFPIEKKK